MIGCRRLKRRTNLSVLVEKRVNKRVKLRNMKQESTRQSAGESKAEAVRRMQRILRERAGDPSFAPGDVPAAANYSARHAERLFRELTGKSIAQYLRLVRLSGSAERLLGTDDAVVDVALDAGFDSHEGFSRAFFRSFRVLPGAYRRDPVPIPLFLQFPADAARQLRRKMEENNMEKTSAVVTVTPILRPRRKLIVLRAERAAEYLSFCEEMGCEWMGLFNSIPEKIDTCALVELPACLTRAGTSPVAAGVEVPDGYDPNKVPDGYELLQLEAGELLYFQTAPYEDEEAYCEAIDRAFEAAEQYDPARYGFAYDLDAAPKFNYGAEGATGARLALPVKRI